MFSKWGGGRIVEGREKAIEKRCEERRRRQQSEEEEE